MKKPPKILPSLDISEGKVVKRVKGIRGTGLELGNPIKWLEFWYNEGALGIHVVDLDAAEKGYPVNKDVILKLISRAKELGMWIQVAGGIRSIDVAQLYSKADSIVIGSKAVKDPKFLEEVSKEIGCEKVIVAIDSKGGRVAIDGWTKTEHYTPLEIIEMLPEKAYTGILYTYIDTEGTLKGPDFETPKKIKSLRPGKVLEYAGGIGSKGHVLKLLETGVDSLIIGMALYSAKLSLRELLDEVM
ncbi:hypothetical protein EYM_03325 [Ignicoccus islandicus DSM 13165]|uniref:1-(5-phosphoribosyl)-5-[(5-phosphoribosylamino)methylideneamino] imidazole-4-carboxamide isomerase n=1 Tax=Ignicoccus islandicus DSM 13165 TaxID=940295 RepID=A0A0U3EAU7_9CREN|nr:1-(5-phosphoribosyl)-5-[(5-phosphoribosylamino)methylideneamino] imidazole-4-carboxamide isomerase [Ignicoccus islandicus]ALU12398.1 hypothetical protein EYM_03325 [Ignicoccus islandicus DSM 13165]